MFILKTRDTAVNSLSFSPDGGTLAAGGYWGYLHLWDLASRSLRREARLGTNNVAALFFAPENRLAALCAGHLGLYDGTTGDGISGHRLGRNGSAVLLAAAPWPRSRFCTVHVAKKSFGCNSFPDMAHQWNAALPDDAYAAHKARLGMFAPAFVSCLSFSGDGNAVAAGCVTGEVFVRRAADGKAIAAIRDKGRPAVAAVALSPDASRLAFCAASHLRLYQLSPLQEIAHASLGSSFL